MCVSEGGGKGQVVWDGGVLTPDFTPGLCWRRTRPGEKFLKKNFRTSDPEQRRGAQETGLNEIRERVLKTNLEEIKH